MRCGVARGLAVAVMLIASSVAGVGVGWAEVDHDGSTGDPTRHHASGLDASILQTRALQHEYLETLEWDRDPFTSGSTGGRASGFALSGILWDAVQPIAIINGETLRVGERLGTYEVLEIGREHVTLSDGTQSFDLDIAQ